MAILKYPNGTNPSYIVLNQEAVTAAVAKELLAAYATRSISVLAGQVFISAGGDSVIQLLFGADVHFEGHAVHPAATLSQAAKVEDGPIHGKVNQALNLISSFTGTVSGYLRVRVDG